MKGYTIREVVMDRGIHDSLLAVEMAMRICECPVSLESVHLSTEGEVLRTWIARNLDYKRNWVFKRKRLISLLKNLIETVHYFYSR